MDRRRFTSGIALGAAGALLAQAGKAASPAGATAGAPAGAAPAAAPFRIGMVLFEGMTYLDYAGPQDAFTKLRGGQVLQLAATREVLKSDSGIRVLPDATFDEAPELDLLFVGGGQGIAAAMENAAILGFLAARAPRARFITSVCTGALVLGAAGLLRGYRAATHWTAMDILPVLGATPVHERVVIDRNRITGGGVTAGLDFGLRVIAEVGGESLAQLVTLGQEYDPQPPYATGSPRIAPPELVKRFRELTAGMTEKRMATARRAAAKFV